jgi:hypothetical protein
VSVAAGPERRVEDSAEDQSLPVEHPLRAVQGVFGTKLSSVQGDVPPGSLELAAHLCGRCLAAAAVKAVSTLAQL